MKKIISIVGARPNFMKMAPLHNALKKHRGIQHKIIHTGQHYDFSLSDVFFKELQLPKPDIFLNAGSGTHAEQTSSIMLKLEKILLKEKPSLIIVYGDVNSTLAASITASKCLLKGVPVPVVHIEAGLRSFDLSMPEEVNRIVTDRLSSYYFVTEESGMQNLLMEGVSRNKIFFTGNMMIDSLKEGLSKGESGILKKLGLKQGHYAAATLHRPSNVDNIEGWKTIIKVLNEISSSINGLNIVFPIHPRTQQKLKEFKIDAEKNINNLVIIPPAGYLDFVTLIKNSRLVITDSGGIQEETTYLKIPCVTLRENTERPVTVTEGSNTLLKREFLESNKLQQLIKRAVNKKGKIPKKWDGKAGERTAKIINKILKDIG